MPVNREEVNVVVDVFSNLTKQKVCDILHIIFCGLLDFPVYTLSYLLTRDFGHMHWYFRIVDFENHYIFFHLVSLYRSEWQVKNKDLV